MTIICIFNLVTKHHQFAATKLRKMADIMCWSWKLLTRWWTWFKDWVSVLQFSTRDWWSALSLLANHTRLCGAITHNQFEYICLHSVLAATVGFFLAAVPAYLWRISPA